MPDNAIPREDMAEYERALKDIGADLGAWEYVKKCVSLKVQVKEVNRRQADAPWTGLARFQEWQPLQQLLLFLRKRRA